jgi:Ca2+-binding RTX toxin-like protein
VTYQLIPNSDLFPAYDDRAGVQARSDITALADGGAVVVYTQSVFPDPDVYVRDYDMFAQRYDADGAAIGELVVIFSFTGTSEVTYDYNGSLYPVVTGLADGGYAVGWRDFTAGDAHVRSYDADGTMRGETIVSLPARDVGGGREAEVSASGGGAYTITALDTGGFALTWEAGYSGILAQYGGAQIIYSQTFTADGAAIGTASPVTPWVGTGSYSVDRWNMMGDSVPLSDGRYVVFMRGGEGAPGNTSEYTAVLGRIYDQNGDALTDNFMVNQNVDLWHAAPSAAAMPDGGFVVTWQGGDVSGWRRFDADGDPVTGDMDLDARYADTKVVAMEDGGFLITARYVSAGAAPYTTYAQRIDENNEPVGEMFVVTSNRSPDPDIVYYHDSPEFVALGNGKILALIEGTATAASGFEADVMVRLYLPDTLGTAADDELTAAADGTAIFGRDGDDLLQGAAAADYLDGENGDDTVTGAEGNDTLVGGDGNDSLDGGAGDDVVIGGLGNDTMIGGDGEDTAVIGVRVAEVTVRGPSDGLIIKHDGSIDVVSGFENFDFKDLYNTDSRTFAEVLELRNIYTYGDSTDDLIYGDYGNDTLIGSYGNDTIFGEAGTDSLEGGAGNDELNGGTGNDMLDGGYGDDVLNGGGGDDVLEAGLGDDTLDGGDGDDRAVFYAFPTADLVVGGPTMQSPSTTMATTIRNTTLSATSRRSSSGPTMIRLSC